MGIACKAQYANFKISHSIFTYSVPASKKGRYLFFIRCPRFIALLQIVKKVVLKVATFF